MEKLLAVGCFIVALAMILFGFPEGPVSFLATLICSVVTVAIIKRFFKEDAEVLTRLFVIALLARLTFGIFLHVYELQEFFGGDANTYDKNGNQLVLLWYGLVDKNTLLSVMATDFTGTGWGMNYLVAFIYFITGRNPFAAQSICAVIGAATVPMIYSCAHQIFANRRVATISAFLVALYPAFIIWSGQLLKDGVIMFLLVLAVTMVLKLQQKLSYVHAVILVFALFGILSLRFYVFYMAVAAAFGSFVVGSGSSTQSIFRRVIVLVVLGLGMTYIGGFQNASDNYDKYASFDKLQAAREYQSRVESGYGKDLDVSTTEGAISALPIGLLYLLLAPFPWQVTNFRQAITLPEIMLWWSSLPILIYGLWYTIKHKLRAALSVLLFTLMLTLAYAVFQGNVGTAYRQRTQIQVFLFMFIAVGWTLMKERRENEILARAAKKSQQISRVQESV